MSINIPAPCEASVIRTAVEAPAASRAGILATTILGSSVAIIDGSVLTVALPAIQIDLALEPPWLQWMVNAYLLPLGALLLLGGASGDRFGQGRVFAVGLLLFGVASVVCALATNVGFLRAGRAAQGVVAALMVPASLAILGGAFEAERRTMAIATWASASAITGAVAPLMGGWLTDSFSWRAIFLINPPLVILTLFLAWRFLRSNGVAPIKSTRGVDWAGAALITTSLGLLSWGLIELGANRHSRWPWVSLGAALLLAAGFLAYEGRRPATAMMPLHLLRSSTFLAVNLLTFLLYAVLGGLMLLLPFLMIRISGWDAVAAGAALVPLPLIIGLLSRSAGRWSERYGVRIFLSGGPLVVAVGMFLLLRVDGADFGFAADVLPGLVVVSLGMALTAIRSSMRYTEELLPL